MSNGTPVVTGQNFDAVNDYIDHLSSRNRSSIELQKANTAGIYLKWLAVLTLATGIAVALMLWAFGSGREKPAPIIVEPRVVQAPDVKVVIEREPLNSGQMTTLQPDPRVATAIVGAQQRIAEIAPTGTVVIDSKSVQTITEPVIDFVIFKNLPFGRGLIDEVVVGMHYPDSNAKIADRQWCYVSTPDENGVEIHVTLAVWRLGEELKTPITVDMARRANVSTDELRAAQRLCQFE